MMTSHSTVPKPPVNSILIYRFLHLVDEKEKFLAEADPTSVPRSIVAPTIPARSNLLSFMIKILMVVNRQIGAPTLTQVCTSVLYPLPAACSERESPEVTG